MKKSVYLIILSFLVGLNGCSDINEAFTDGYSENPNAPTDAPPEELFIGAQTAAIQFLEGRPAQWSTIWTRHATGADKAFAGYNNYNMSFGDFNTIFSIPYTEVRSNLQLVRSKSTAMGGRDNLIAVSKIMESIVMGMATALWGNIPYSEANKESVSDPQYDEQVQVYSAIQTQLDSAITSLENSRQDLSTGVDVYSYDGDVDKWIKAAYTLKARFYMHVGSYEEAIMVAEKGIADLSGNGDLNIPHGDVYSGNANIYHQFLTNVTVGFMDASQTNAIPLLESRNNSKTDESGRLNFYYTSDRKDLNIERAFTRSASFPLITAVENQLILAEAYARRNTHQDNQTALSYLNKARQYNQNKFPNTSYNDLSVADFQQGGAYDDTTIKQEIFDETYLSLAFQIESFNFCRRIDYQVSGLEPVSGQSQFPERFLYPQSEISTNENTPNQEVDALFKPTPVNQ